MEVKKRDKVVSPIVLNSQKYNEEIGEYVRGYFYEKDSIETNTDFLECLAAVLYWDVEFPTMLIEYSKKPNYNSKGLISDIKLINEFVFYDTICDSLISNIEKASFEPQVVDLSEKEKELCEQIINDEEIENKYIHLVINNLSRFTQYFIDAGVDMEDIMFDESDALEGFRVLSVMLENGFDISIELIYQYINSGFGSIVKKCFEHKGSNFFTDDLPVDHETLDFFKSNNEINKDVYERILHNSLDLKIGSISYILFLYYSSNITSKKMKLSLLTNVLNINNKLLTTIFIIELFESGISAGDLYCNIYNLNKNIQGYMIYQLRLIANNNLEYVYSNVKKLIQENKKNEYTLNEIYDAEFDSSDCDDTELTYREELEIKNNQFDELLIELMTDRRDFNPGYFHDEEEIFV